MNLHPRLAALLTGALLALLVQARASAELYFSRSDPVEKILVNEINRATKSIHLLMYSFTDDALAGALIQAQRRGVDVKIVFDRSQTFEKHSLANFALEKLGPSRVEFRTGKGRGIMHEKMAIYDSVDVSLGSFNWTENARDNNWENLEIIHDTKIAATCEREFQRVWNSPDKDK